MADSSSSPSSSPSPSSPSPPSWLMGDAFQARMPHHDGIAALWSSRWQQPCRRAAYPFHDGHYDDFAPVFARLIAGHVDDPNAAAYTEAFFPEAEALEAQADQLLLLRGETGDADAADAAAASALYLRACALYRIARFPYIAATTPTGAPPDPAKWRAWQAQKRLYLRAAATWAAPVREVAVPHVHARAGEGATIPVYLRMPVPETTTTGPEPVPVVVLMTGLDGYRPDNTGRCDEFARRGWASVVVEIPGTADCPADAADPTSAERLWDSLFAWMATVPALDTAPPRRIAVWGLSAGGYYAVRAAHTHATWLAGVVAQGAGVHHFFSAAWLARADGHEYPFALTPALAAKHGCASTAEYAATAQRRFSLLEAGLLDQPASAPLLLVNGTADGLMPIEDSLLLLLHGRPKTARFVEGALHMGYPEANTVVYPWLEEVLEGGK